MAGARGGGLLRTLFHRSGRSSAAPQVRPRSTGLLELSLVAPTRANCPFALSFPVVANAAPQISDVMISDTSVVAGLREMITVSARVQDDCGVSRVSAELDAGRGFRRVASMSDDGRNGDPVARDGVFTGLAQVLLPAPGTFPLRVMATDALRATAFSSSMDIRPSPVPGGAGRSIAKRAPPDPRPRW
jgi:hypothetical protein